MGIFDIEGPVVRFLGKVADLMWLNILTMICSIPVFTIGASFTALHYMCLKIVRNEESYITKGYFKSFKENFRQSTIMWLMILAVAAFLGTDFYIMANSGLQFHYVFRLILLAITVLMAFTAVMIFPLQAKFDNPIKITIKNAFTVSVLQFPQTFAMIVLLVLPIFLCYYAIQVFPLVFLLGFSLPAYLSAHLYNRIFLSMEKQCLERLEQAEESEAEEDETEEDERIFKDEQDENLTADEILVTEDLFMADKTPSADESIADESMAAEDDSQ